MIKIILLVLLVIAVTFGLVRLIDRFLPKKLKPLLMLGLWAFILIFGYLTFMSVYGEIQFNKLKDDRYKVVIENLKDVRDAQLAYRTVTGKFANNWDGLVKFIDTAEFTITQRRDSSVLDVEATKRFGGVEMYEDIVIIDTLGFESVKDSLFGADNRYKTMMNYPVGDTSKKFEIEAGEIEQNSIMIPVFEVRALKEVILSGEDKYLIANEKEVMSVDGVNGPSITVGSMNEVNTNGNWPKTYSKDQ